MDASQQHSYVRDTKEGRVLYRGAYSPKPLYFLEQPIGRKWLVSHSLREIGAYVNYCPSPEGIRDFLCYGFVPAPRTIFQGILAVPPNKACCLPYDSAVVEWHEAKKLALSTINHPEALFWQQLCQHSQLDRASILLSGGLDSAMVAVAASASATQLHAYHARFSGGDSNEGSDTHAARLTAKHLGLAYQEININSLDALRYFHQVVSALDQPLGDPVTLPFYLLCNIIQTQYPQQAVLTGEGGDQLFGSWSMKPMLMRELYPEAGYQREQGYLESFHKFADEWQGLIAAHLGEQLDRRVLLTDPIHHAFASSPSGDFCNLVRWVDLQLKGMQHILPRIEAIAAAHHLPLQHPFFQPDMIETGICLPNSAKFSGVTDKVLLKQLAKNKLPDSVIERRKQGMGVPTSSWFRWGLRPLAMYWLNKKRLAQSGLLNPDTVQAIRQQTVITQDGRGRRWGDRLWMLCVLECWFASLQK